MNRRIALRTLLASAGAVTLSACAGFQLPRPGGRVGGDGKPLSLAVLDALRKNSETSTLALIEVYSTEDDVIILKGPVPTDDKFYAVERIALQVEGVARVDNGTFVRN